MKKPLVILLSALLFGSNTSVFAEEPEGSFFNMHSEDSDEIYGDTTFGFSRAKPTEEELSEEEQKAQRAKKYQQELSYRMNIEEERKKRNAELTEQYFINKVLEQQDGRLTPEQRMALQSEIKQSRNRANEYINSQNQAREALDDIRRVAENSQAKPAPADEQTYSEEENYNYQGYQNGYETYDTYKQNSLHPSEDNVFFRVH